MGPGQTPVSLLSLLARWSDKADQTGVTLRSDKEKRKKFLKKRRKKKANLVSQTLRREEDEFELGVGGMGGEVLGCVLRNGFLKSSCE